MTDEELLQRIADAARKQATELDLSDEQLTAIPPQIGQLTQLRYLDLSGNQLTAIPPEIGQLTNLTTLIFGSRDVGRNQLRVLPPEIGQLTQLTRLNLGRNQLTPLPPEIGQLTQLTELCLVGNQLTALPPEIGQLIRLTDLDLSDNQLTAVPSDINQLTQLTRLDMSRNELTALPPEIGQLTQMTNLALASNQLTALPPEIGQLTQLTYLLLGDNQLCALPPEIGQLTQLSVLDLSSNPLTTFPLEIGQLTRLTWLDLVQNGLTRLPPEIRRLTQLTTLLLSRNRLTALPPQIGQLTRLTRLQLYHNQLTALPPQIGQLTQLRELGLNHNQLTTLPPQIGQLTQLERLDLSHIQLIALPPEIGQLTQLITFYLSRNHLTVLPPEIAQLPNLRHLSLAGNPLAPALQSAYNQGLDALRAYLLSLEHAEPLYEAKLILVGEGGVGKTTLLKAMTRLQPREGEPTTHGVDIDVQSLRLPHPHQDEIEIQLNTWDFGGQEVYRVTHQFFFSRRSIYLLVWEPRRGVQQCQVEDWLRLIRLRVGDDARVIVVSTHCKTGDRIARIDKPILRRDFGSIIAAFHEVDSLVPDPDTGDMVGVAELKQLIARTAQDLEQMGMPFNPNWRAARDELLAMPQPRIPYARFAAVCQQHGLDPLATRTLANLMHDLGYVVYYGDDDRLKDDVVLQPQWLTKAISFVLEDRATQEMGGILPDARLREVWRGHPFEGEPRYDPALYPFFLRLMKKYDVLYRLDEQDASLVAQHVSQVRPDLPWLPEEDPAPDRRRIAMVCVMDETPPGLVPWMIVRTHEYAYQQRCADGKTHRLHWQKGMFLRNTRHGEALLELRGREFHIYAEAVWPEYFMNVLRRTLHKLIADNWPGLQDHYHFAVPCRHRSNGRPCDGRFDIAALRQFLDEGDTTFPCQACRTRQNIVELLYGFEEPPLDQQWRAIEERLAGLESRIANYFWAIMHAIATESKFGPRLFTIEPVGADRRQPIAKRYRLHLWCEAEGCQHPVLEQGKGIYDFKATRQWLQQVAPYANFIAGVLKTLLPMAAPAVNVFFGADTIKQLGLKDHLDLVQKATAKLLPEITVSDPSRLRQGVLTEAQRSGLLALHAFLRKNDPNHKHLGLRRMPTPTGDYIWLCQKHYDQAQPKIPDTIE